MLRLIGGVAMVAFCLGTHSLEAGLAQSLEGDPKAQEERQGQKAERVYGLPSLGRLASRRVEARRLLLLDARRRDAGAISFTRARGAAPKVSFRAAGRRHPRLEAEIPVATWNEATERFASLYRTRPSPAAEPLCLDAWTALAETAEPGGAPQKRGIIDLCPDPGSVLWFAKVAAAALPPCSLIDSSASDAIGQLVTCSALYGDRTAAAEITGALAQFSGFGGVDADSKEPFAQDGVVDWQGRVVAGRGAAAAWRDRLAALPEVDLYVDRIVGINRDRVEVQASLFFRTYAGSGDTLGRLFSAPVGMAWVRGAGNRFWIQRVHVGAFRPLQR